MVLHLICFVDFTCFNHFGVFAFSTTPTCPGIQLSGCYNTRAHSRFFHGLCAKMSQSDPVPNTLEDEHQPCTCAVDPSTPQVPPRSQRLSGLIKPNPDIVDASSNRVALSSLNLGCVSPAEHSSACSTPVDSRDQPFRPHRFHCVSISCPQLCSFCNDYIITPRCSAFRCSHCRALFHAACSRVASRANRVPCSRMDHVQYSQMDPIIPIDPELSGRNSSTHTSAISTAEQVLSGRQPGAGEDASLTSTTLVTSEEGSTNTSEHMMNHASTPTPPPPPPPPKPAGDPLTVGVNATHELQICSFLQEVACALCRLPLLGLSRQGYQCFLCGMIFHRVCAALDDLPECAREPPPAVDMDPPMSICSDTLDYMHLPTRLSPSNSGYFGVALEQQPLDPISKVPSFLLVCTAEIERLSSNSFTPASDNQPVEPIDLVSAYQQSALTSTLYNLRQQFAHVLPTADLVGSDVVRLTQLLKAFLRELPVSVIPETNYKDFCALSFRVTYLYFHLLSTLFIRDDRTEAVQKFLHELPEVHRRCLEHTMKHLDFVWCHQRRLRDHIWPEDASQSSFSSTSISRAQLMCKPINWLLVFRQILIRPPWPKLTDLATGLDVHLQALQTVFFSLASSTVHEPNVSLRLEPTVLHSSVPKTLTASSTEPCQADYGVVDLPSVEPTNIDIPGPTVHTPPSTTSKTENMRDLSTREWYWGNVTQVEVREIMAGLPDGFFLVRDASESSAGAFTLVVRRQGDNKLFRIYHRGDYFGVYDPPPPVFRLVSQLIEYYCSHSILFGEELMLRPISHRHNRFLASTTSRLSTSSSSGSLPIASPSAQRALSSQLAPSSRELGVFACYLPKEQLFNELSRTDSELNRCDARIKELASLGRTATQSREEAARLIKGHRKLQEWLRLQKTRLNESTGPKDKGALSRHFELLDQELRKSEGQLNESIRQFAVKSNQYRDLLEDQVQSNSRRRKLRRQAQEIRRALKEQGVPEELILSRTMRSMTDRSPSTESTTVTSDNAFRPRSSNLHPLSSSLGTITLDDYENIGPNSNLGINDRTTWFMADFSRDQAEELLRNKPVGTFLIRTSSEGRRLALSIRLSTSVQHCLIYHVDNRYGFVQQSCTFDSLEALVLFYHMNSLKQHNILLNTTLRYPALAVHL
ncbi:phosphoinositide-3-kinase regulatory subunit alpha/beta/delta [Paragonimus westermani]|uniref:Phosphoinositide-3-kinase regulatory subunit alpha/beta/delta n=1 Tax=Paragonimus westermani TaxID=34504 RepID=A0A5J4NNQ8_9TREM|nr:phosphoinositide-3-kinase regulatory subunit alpha/beta/delta [Paragonimus westermani]